MRIGIREQLGLLVLLTTLIALAVVAIATWVNNYNFVLNIRSSALSLTASLYANQLSANLLLLQSGVQALSTRVLLQNALQRYNSGNNTDANWARAITDLQSAMAGSGSASLLVQAQVFSKNGSGVGAPYSLMNVTGVGVCRSIHLPYQNASGQTVSLGQNGTGYPSNLYPNLTYTSTPVNSSFNISNASYSGTDFHSDTVFVIGPWLLNSSFALLSITVPVVNTTAPIDTLGWLTVVASAESLFDIDQATQGLEKTGEILLVKPTTIDQRLPDKLRLGKSNEVNITALKSQEVTFVLPPVQNASRSSRHPAHAYGAPSEPFQVQDYPALVNAYSAEYGRANGAGSMISTRNEDGDHVAVGYALPISRMVDWALVVEQSYKEVIGPIRHLRAILLACVFGTVGALLLFLLPIAHLSVRPIRRLREATKKTVEPDPPPSEEDSIRSFQSEENESHGSVADEPAVEIAKKEGFLGRVGHWRNGRAIAQEKSRSSAERSQAFRIPGKVEDRKHVVHDELTDLTRTFNEMSDELTKYYERLEEKVKERTAELEVSKKAAEAANEAKTLFIANISHELKTPLNGILGMCTVCMQEDDAAKLKRSLGIIWKSGDLLLHLLTDLLTFTKNENGRQISLDERDFRLADVCSQVLSIFEKQAKDSKINLAITYQGPKDGPDSAAGSHLQSGFGPYGTGRVKDMFLWGDQHRILQVVINLVNNSLKFTPTGGTVDVRIRCLGDAPEPTESRKGSVQSRKSKRQSSRGSRQKYNRATSSSGSMISSIKRGREGTRRTDGIFSAQANDHRMTPSAGHRDRSSSPLPVNARTLLFEFEVEDTGPGIPEDQQQRVFEPFMQGDLGLSKKYGGTGLGLSICSQLAKLMKGHLRLESQLGKGSKFTMQIPLIFVKEKADSMTSSAVNSRRNSVNLQMYIDNAQSPQRRRSSSDVSVRTESSIPTAMNGLDTAAKPRLVGLSQPFFAATSPLEDADTQLAAMEQVAAQAAQSGDRIRVLVAEDNIVNQEVVLRMLKLEDIYDVTVAKDGKEALDLVRQSMEERKYFNLIFMDVQMPNLDGIQSTKLIRQMGYHAPIVALTAYAEESNQKECRESGMNEFLAKPIKRPELKKVLKQFCATIPEAPEEPLHDKHQKTNGHPPPAV